MTELHSPGTEYPTPPSHYWDKNSETTNQLKVWALAEDWALLQKIFFDHLLPQLPP